MKCYRVYNKGECVGTFFNITQAVQHMDLFLKYGEDPKIEIEEY